MAKVQLYLVCISFFFILLNILRVVVVVVLNATFDNIPFTWCQSVLLVVEAGLPG